MGLKNWIGRTFGLKDKKPWAYFLASGSYSGKAVNAETAMQLSAVWTCVRLISETVASLPLGLYKRESNGGRVAADQHRLHGILAANPNADQTSVEFWEGQTAGLCLWGNSFAEKKMKGREVIALDPLPHESYIRRNSAGVPELVVVDRGNNEILPIEKVFHTKGFGTGGDMGLSPISFARHAFGGAMAADEAAAKMFANGMQPTGVLQMDSILKKEHRDQMQKNIIDPLSGASNSGKVMLLEAGMKFQQLSLAPEDAQMLETRRFNIEEICRWFRVPPILAQHSAEGQTMWGSGIEHIMIGWLTLGLRTYLRRTEASINKRLLRPEERGEYYAQFNVEGLLRGDSAARSEFYSKMTQNGIFSRNEVRHLENRPSKPGADELTVQSNMIELSQMGKSE